MWICLLFIFILEIFDVGRLHSSYHSAGTQACDCNRSGSIPMRGNIFLYYYFLARNSTCNASRIQQKVETLLSKWLLLTRLCAVYSVKLNKHFNEFCDETFCFLFFVQFYKYYTYINNMLSLYCRIQRRKKKSFENVTMNKWVNCFVGFIT